MNIFERHALSAVMHNMPEDEFNGLVFDVARNGFIDPVIITHDGLILDGWHRYRVAKQLGKVSELVFEKLTGISPNDFVVSKNIRRRHLTASQRGQMVVEAHEWATGGGDRMSDEYSTTSSNDEVVKTREEMAEQANVSTPTIDRAKQVSRAGRAEEVISGEKSASAVIEEEREKAAPVEQEERLPLLEPPEEKRAKRYLVMEERDNVAAAAPDFVEPEDVFDESLEDRLLSFRGSEIEDVFLEAADKIGGSLKSASMNDFKVLQEVLLYCITEDDIGVPLEGTPLPRMPVTVRQRSQWIEFCTAAETILSLFWDKAVLKVTEDSDEGDN